MEESHESNLREESQESDNKDIIFTKTVKAGRRTYFFDIKCGRNDNHYMTITESRKHLNRKGVSVYQRSKIFLFSEDVVKFIEGLSEAAVYLGAENSLSAEGKPHAANSPTTDEAVLAESEFTDITFEDLDR